MVGGHLYLFVYIDDSSFRGSGGGRGGGVGGVGFMMTNK